MPRQIHFVSRRRIRRWSPNDLIPLAWWDASDISTVTTSGNDATKWNDKSGNENHAVQNNTNLSPQYGIRSVNGLNVINFKGNDFFQVDAFGNFEQTTFTYSLFFAFLSDDFNGIRLLLSMSPSSGSGAKEVMLGFREFFGFRTTHYAEEEDDPGSAQFTQLGSFQTGVVHSFVMSNDGSNAKTWINNVKSTSSHSFDMSGENFTDFLIGARANGSFYLDGALCEFCIRREDATDLEANRWHQYCVNKWGV